MSALVHSPALSQDTEEEVYDKEVLDRSSTAGEEDDSQSDDEVADAESDDDALSIDDLLQEKNARIDALERSNRMKDERLQLLQQKLNETKVKHKEGIYWLQLELDSARRENEATEEQMAELVQDLKGMTQLPNSNDLSKDILREEIIKNYEEALASMDNQMTMIKTSAGEIVKTLKEEIADLMEDRASMEVDLLNQLAVLNNEKTSRQQEYEYELKVKDDAIHRLMLAGGTATTSAETADLEEYELEIGRLMDVQKKTQEKLTKAREEANEEIQRLELDNAQLKSDLERAEDDLAALESENSAETIQALLVETQNMKSTLDQRSIALEAMKIEQKALENEIARLKSANAVSNDNNSKPKDEETKSSSERSSHSNLLNGISKAIVDQLQLEVLRILERMKEKNDLIQAMKVKIEDQKTAEERLKNELKRALRKAATQTKSQGSTKSAPDSPLIQSPQPSPKTVVAAISPSNPAPKAVVASLSPRNPAPKAVVAAISPRNPAPKGVVAAISPSGAAPKAAVASMDPTPTTPPPRSPSKLARRASGQNSLRTPKRLTSPIPMLKPSPREISKSRLFSGLLGPEQMGTKSGLSPESNPLN